jgi:hypothetical protein
VDPSAKLGRTREFIAGIQHELIPNLAVGVDYVYRKYDRGTSDYPIGFQPGAAGFPLTSLYQGPITYTDPTTGISAPYFQVCPTCMQPSGVGTISVLPSQSLVHSFSSRVQPLLFSIISLLHHHHHHHHHLIANISFRSPR